ncbi:hypothetical protein J7643_14365 [bacterium]|nr:hypothetical protein [bacterium]
MRSRAGYLGGLGLCALLLLVGCPGPEDEDIIGTVGPKPTETADKNVGGSVGDETPPATRSATPEPVTRTPSPKPTASAKVGIKSVSVSNIAIALYPPAQDEALGLGYPSWRQLSGQAMRTDDFPSGVVWSDRSGGQLVVSPTGRIETKASTQPGTYWVRCAALDDVNVYQDVAVEVRPTSELEVIIR